MRATQRSRVAPACRFFRQTIRLHCTATTWVRLVPTIVISYRRDDSKAIAGRIFDRLEGHYGTGRVFMDIDSIPFGLDFREHIRDTLQRCDILVAVIGRNWLDVDEDGRSRIADETDWVRIEIEAALAKNIPVIPVLVDGIRMPKSSDLPDSMRSFVFRQAAEVDSGRDFRMHMERLIRSMDELLDRQRPQATPQSTVLDPVSRMSREGGSQERAQPEEIPERQGVKQPHVADQAPEGPQTLETLSLSETLAMRWKQVVCEVAGIVLLMLSIMLSGGGSDFRGGPGLILTAGLAAMAYGVYLFFSENPNRGNKR
jgi:TIR domain